MVKKSRTPKGSDRELDASCKQRVADLAEQLQVSSHANLRDELGDWLLDSYFDYKFR